MTTITVPICDSFSAAAGTGINWTGFPGSGCVIEPITGSAWPFTEGPPIRLPSPTNPAAELRTGLTSGQKYCFRVSCCDRPVCVTAV